MGRIGDSLSGIYYFFLGLIFLGLAGCSSASRPQPQATPADTGARSGQRGSQSSSQGIGERGAGAAPRPSERSSLEALQRGEKPVTSPSSPLKEIYFDYDRYDVRTDARQRSGAMPIG
jgi:hypothetical protein